MNARERLLVGILAALIVVVGPFYMLDRMLQAKRAEVTAAESAAVPMRQKATEVKDRQAAIQKLDEEQRLLFQRLVGSDPPREIRTELDRVAAKSGMTLGSFSLQAGEAVPDLPEVVRFRVSISVAGSRTQYIAFLQGLEQSRYAIEIPDVALNIAPSAKLTPSSGGGKPPTSEVNLSLQLSFFGKANK